MMPKLGWLLHCIIKWWPPKAKAPPLYFFMGLVLVPHTRGQDMVPPYPMACALHGPLRSSGVMSWGHRCSTHRERAKPLEGRVAAAHFGCVCLLLLLYTLLFSHPYKPGCTQGNTKPKHCHVVLNIQPMLYFHGENCTSIQRNLNPPQTKHDVEGVFGHIFTM